MGPEEVTSFAWWIVLASGGLFASTVLVGYGLEGAVHSTAPLAGAVFAWGLVFVVLPTTQVWIMLVGVAVATSVGHVIAGSPENFHVVVMVSVAAMIVAFPFSPRHRRWLLLALACLTMIAIVPTGGEDRVSILLFAVTADAVMVVGYRILGALERAIDRSDDDRRALLEAIDRAPVFAAVVDFSEAAAILQSVPVDRVGSMLDEDPALPARLYATGRITWANVVTRRRFGIDDLATDVRFGEDVPAPAHVEQMHAFLTALRRGQRHYSVTNETISKNGNRHWIQADWLLPVERPDRCFIVATDVTDIVRARESLERLIEDKDRFVATISHELRTPLTAVLGFAGEALEGIGDTDPQMFADYIGLVVEQAQEMSFIIEDLLAAARADTGSLTVAPEPFELRELALRLASAARGAVSVEIESDPWVVADPVRVRQILRNLISNAVRYGGTVRRLVGFTDGDTVVVEARNDGPAVRPDMVESIFEPYVSAHLPHAVTGSIGLGLAVSRQLARLMGGDLVHERDGDETVFRLTLPAGEPPLAATRGGLGQKAS